MVGDDGRVHQHSWLRRRFNQFLNPAGEGSKDSLYYLFVAALGFMVIVFLFALLYRPGADGGVLGDFVGGMLNPILTFLTFMALLITIILQQTELRATKEELAKSAIALEKQIKTLDRQNFESTFFQMLRMFQAIVGSIEVEHGLVRLRGQAALECLRDKFLSTWRDTLGDDEKRLHETYDVFWRSYGSSLASYYRFLESMVVFVENSDVDQRRYMRFVKGTMSDTEIMLLHYRAMLENYGDRLRVPVQKYGMLEGLVEKQLAEPSHKRWYSDFAYRDGTEDETKIVRNPMK